MRGVKPPGARGPAVPGRPEAAGRSVGGRGAGAKLKRAGRQLGSAPKSAARALKKQAEGAGEALGPDRTPTEDEEQVAYMRKHAADLEEESRRHVSGDSNAEVARQEEEEAMKRKVAGLNFDERRKKRGRRRSDEDEDDEQEPDEAAEKAAQWLGGGSRSSAFDDSPEDRMGDLTLTDPNEMKRILGPSARFAQHAMMLAEQKRDEGTDRSGAIGFLAGLYVGLDDRAYAEKALRAFGPATGILDIYPLEVLGHLLEHVPDFFTKTRQAPIFGGELTVLARPGATVTLAYPPELRIRGFALDGGPRPGYRFEPTDPEGHYHLTVDAEGRFHALISAITKDGWLLIDGVDLIVEADAPEPPEVQRAEKTASAPEAPIKDRAAPEKEDKRLPDELSKLHFPRRI